MDIVPFLPCPNLARCGSKFTKYVDYAESESRNTNWWIYWMIWDGLVNTSMSHWSQFFDFMCQLVPRYDSMLRVIRMTFVQRGAFQFSLIALKWGERKIGLTLGQRYRNSKISILDTVIHVNRWKFQGDRLVGVCSYEEHSNVYQLRSMDATWWPDLEWPGYDIFITCADVISAKDTGGPNTTGAD